MAKDSTRSGTTSRTAGEALPTGRRKRRTPEEIMERLLSAASEEFMQFGFAGATTAAIARRADVTEAQLFRYFNSKGDIFQAAIFAPLGRLLESFTERYAVHIKPTDNIRSVVRSYIMDLLAFIRQHSKMFLSLIVAEAYASDKAQGVSGLQGLHLYFERGAKAMESRLGEQTPVNAQLMVRVSFAAVLACVLFKDWIFPENLATAEQIDNAIIAFVIDGINANPDPGLSEL
ncbi:TetR/AcrR family transcriptional regulator [Halioxenophilus sp. WMMB6]|uniref:TetR/AcrR family transcriptional regulator n=1 Tax=Halioxenophilus sp. WMMB6 TaxID=3073815 RepID=UPI00295F2D61|nr:TetR/AcrR family transcriptional regulator [Halioxenophilus sp. WMMB6]